MLYSRLHEPETNRITTVANRRLLDAAELAIAMRPSDAVAAALRQARWAALEPDPNGLISLAAADSLGHAIDSHLESY